jgi:hypothetical protein
MIIFLQELVMQLFIWILMLIDGIMEIFTAIAGVSTINYHGQQINIVEYLLGDSTIATIFWCIFILSVGLTCIFAIVGLIKNMVANNKTVSAIVGKFFLSLLGTMAMLTAVVLGILIANGFLVLLSDIFQIANTEKLSDALFNACVRNWSNGYSVAEVDVSSMSVRDVLGDYNTVAFGIWPSSWKNNGMVDPSTFMYFPSLIASVGLGIAVIVAVVNLAKRVYEIVFLYLVMPISMSTLPIDDGARFKNWRETFVSKVVLAYGTVLSVNIFMLILPLISQMKIDNVSSFANSVFIVFMIIGGALVIPAGQTLFVRLFGSGDDMHAGGSFLRSAFYGTRFASMATIGLASKVVRGTVNAGRRMAGHRGNEETDDRYSDGRDNADGGDTGGNG